jgi:hypothetical protein
MLFHIYIHFASRAHTVSVARKCKGTVVTLSTDRLDLYSLHFSCFPPRK